MEQGTLSTKATPALNSRSLGNSRGLSHGDGRAILKMKMKMKRPG